MNIEFDVYKQKLNDCKPALDGLADSLNLPLVDVRSRFLSRRDYRSLIARDGKKAK